MNIGNTECSKLNREDEVQFGDQFTGTKVEAGGNSTHCPTLSTQIIVRCRYSDCLTAWTHLGANEHSLGFNNRHRGRLYRLNNAGSWKSHCNRYGDTGKIPVVKLVRHGSRNEFAAYAFVRDDCQAQFYEQKKLLHATLDVHKTLAEMMEHRKMFYYDTQQVGVI